MGTGKPRAATGPTTSTPRQQRRCGICKLRDRPRCDPTDPACTKSPLRSDWVPNRSPSEKRKMPPFKEDQIMIISPGSYMVLAQLGLPESFTPAQVRVKSRMFPGEKDGEWEPYRVRQKEKSKPVTGAPKPTNGAANGAATEATDLYEDWDTDEGAVWPMTNGKITNWSCFLALLNHVYDKLSPHMNIQTPILCTSQPCWTERDHEQLTQFFFEKFRCPAFALMDAANAALYGFNVESACVVDVGYTKADITAVSGFQIEQTGRTIALPQCGGEAMTQTLLKHLQSKGFTRDMCEQLKRSPICEILPPGTPLPGADAMEVDEVTNPAAAASTGATGSGPGQRNTAGAMGDAPLGPGPDTEVGDENGTGDDNEGVLDVASIVTGGEKKMEEFLARKEREKQEKAAKKKGGAADAAKGNEAKTVKLPNSKRQKATFTYADYAVLDALKNMSLSSEKMAQARSTLDEGAGKKDTANGEASVSGNDGTVDNSVVAAAAANLGIAGAPRREIEVGTERFQAASDGILERIADAIHRTISAVDVVKRSDVWDNLILIGNGAKLRGFREALLSIIQKKYIISPSSATIFTSELPSNFSTPAGTGAQTPQPSLAPGGPGHHSSSVNPLLLAATTASNPHLAPHLGGASAAAQSSAIGGGGGGGGGGNANNSNNNLHSSHGQTPTSARYAKPMDYFPEWKTAGFDEAHFLGAQVAAKIFFVSPPGDCKTYLSRSDYNEMGPAGIHGVYL